MPDSLKATETPRERFVAALRGDEPTVQPVAPLYLGLYLAGPRHYARARRWRERAEAGGGVLEVGYDDYLTVELEVWREGYGLFAALPDWLAVPSVSSPAGIAGSIVAVDAEGCFWQAPNGQRTQLDRPFTDSAPPLWEAEEPPRTVADVEARMTVSASEAIIDAGTYELARRLVSEMGEEYALHWSTSAPYPGAYQMLGFSGMMLAMREQPELIIAIAERKLANAVAGAAAARNAGLEHVFIEEWACSADLISPEDYLTFAWPFERDLCRELKRLGFSIVFYFCGSIEDRLDHLVKLDADALAFEESRKGWTVDIGDVRQRVGPRRCFFGNLDVVRVRDAARGSLTQEVHRLIEVAGPAAFVTSMGSPITLDTPPSKVDVVMEAARSCR